MKKYQQLAEQLREQIASGIWQPGDRLPSLRDQVALSGMSFMTVSHAYQLLESQGYIIARPQSGYYVAPQAIKMPKAPVIPVTRDEAVDINTYLSLEHYPLNHQVYLGLLLKRYQFLNSCFQFLTSTEWNIFLASRLPFLLL